MSIGKAWFRWDRESLIITLVYLALYKSAYLNPIGLNFKQRISICLTEAFRWNCDAVLYRKMIAMFSRVQSRAEIQLERSTNQLFSVRAEQAGHTGRTGSIRTQLRPVALAFTGP